MSKEEVGKVVRHVNLVGVGQHAKPFLNVGDVNLPVTKATRSKEQFYDPYSLRQQEQFYNPYSLRQQEQFYNPYSPTTQEQFYDPYSLNDKDKQVITCPCGSVAI